MDHKENQSPAQQRRQLQIAELIRNTWGFSKDFSVNEVKHVLGILSVNSFVVHDGAEDGLDLIGEIKISLVLAQAPLFPCYQIDDVMNLCFRIISLDQPDIPLLCSKCEDHHQR